MLARLLQNVTSDLFHILSRGQDTNFHFSFEEEDGGPSSILFASLHPLCFRRCDDLVMWFQLTHTRI